MKRITRWIRQKRDSKGKLIQEWEHWCIEDGWVNTEVPGHLDKPEYTKKFEDGEWGKSHVFLNDEQVLVDHKGNKL